MGIQGVEKPATIITKSASSVASEATDAAATAASTAAEGLAHKIMDAAKVVLQDTDADGMEHNEL